jgi:hypothetical protein
MVLPVQVGVESGLTKDHVQRKKKYGGGYLVNVEGLHHLHCLVCPCPVHRFTLLGSDKSIYVKEPTPEVPPL